MKGLVIIPFIDCLDDTRDALGDALEQLRGTSDVLLIDQGSTDTRTRQWADQVQELSHVRLWRHAPPMPSLAATWNAALDYAWEAGYPDAMVWNNDVRVAPWMYAALREVAAKHALWFCTPINCQGSDPEAWRAPIDAETHGLSLGGPDFSCFLITPECHAKYRFDERFQPAYHEDGDYHRRQWLGGDGGKIAGCTLPYLHYGSRTIHRSPEVHAAFVRQFEVCRVRYVQKWGGVPHHERKVTPDSAEDLDGVGTPGGYLTMAPPQVEAARG